MIGKTRRKFFQGLENWCAVNEFKQLFGYVLITIAILPFLWWGQIWFKNSLQARGRLRSLLLLLGIVFLAYLIFTIWPRTA